MAWCLLGIKPLPGPIMTLCQWCPGKQLSVNYIQNTFFSLKKMHVKISSAKCQPFCLGFNVMNWVPPHEFSKDPKSWLLVTFQWCRYHDECMCWTWDFIKYICRPYINYSISNSIESVLSCFTFKTESLISMIRLKLFCETWYRKQLFQISSVFEANIFTLSKDEQM